MKKTLDRIRKVLALANGTDNPAEAELMMMKVQSMLDEHNLTLLDVENASEEDPIATDKDVYHHFVKDGWKKWTVVRLGNLYGVKTSWYKMTKNKTVISVTGRESARITLELMLPYVLKEIRAKARVLVSEKGYSKAKAERYVANALNERMREMYRATLDDRNAMAGTGRDLIPVDEIKAKFDEDIGKTRTVTDRSKADDERARELADEISLDKQMGTKKREMIE